MAVCDFCKKDTVPTWPTTEWTDTFVRLFDLYEPTVDQTQDGEHLPIQIQEDWHIFTFASVSQIEEFLLTAFPNGHPLLKVGTRVRLRFGNSGPNADHRVSWSRFSEEIRLRNRYFPQSEPDKDLLALALQGSVTSIAKGTQFYRARILTSDEPIDADAMGAPPTNRAVAGRANPVGIPYLYLSDKIRTCIYETRVANHTEVAVGTFHTVRELKLLNLAKIPTPDFFSTDNPVANISFYRYLQELGNELKKPVRSSDQPVDYIPTQYLCELAKSSGLDGVLYSSSLDPGGSNVVLFDVKAASCNTNVQIARITSLHAEWTFET